MGVNVEVGVSDLYCVHGNRLAHECQVRPKAADRWQVEQDQAKKRAQMITALATDGLGNPYARNVRKKNATNPPTILTKTKHGTKR